VATETATARFVDEPEYRMNHKRRGYALIINNRQFKNMPAREGTDIDAKCLEATLGRLGFDTKLFHDCTASSMRNLATYYSKLDHDDADCFVCAVLSHGENGVLYGVDSELDVDQLTRLFKTSRSLAGKPKIFILQACRGSQLMESVDTNPFETYSVGRIPMEADFLLCYSTVAGFYSWRNSQSGSWFIQSLCAIFDEHGSELEVIQLLTLVNRRVAYYYKSNASEPSMSGKRQVPCIVSMLTKELYFKPKVGLNQATSASYA
jgi:caspase 7